MKNIFLLILTLFTFLNTQAITRVPTNGLSIPRGTIPYGASGDIGAATAVGSVGQLLKSNGTSTPVWYSITKSDVGLSNVDNTSDATKDAATSTLTNKTLIAPIIATISNVGLLTLPTSTQTMVGRSTVDTLSNKTLTLPIVSSILNTGTLTLPTTTDTLVARTTTDTLTNKTIDSDFNTITNITNAQIKAAAAIARNKLAATTASRAMVSDGSGFDSVATTTATEIGYVNGVTSAIQTQLDTKAPTSTTVTLTGTQALTNKDYDGGTASNTSRFTLPKDAKTNLDSLTRKAGTLVYDTTSNKPYFDNGSALAVFGTSSGGGAKNYISGGDAEAGTTGFSTYNDAAGSSPIDGTGGTPSITWTTTTSTPLESSNSFLLTKAGTNRQGDGVGYAFTIDTQDKAKVLQISFNYLVNSGTFAASTSSASSDVTVWIYDVTNAIMISPSYQQLNSNSTTLATQFNATFQTASNSTSYRLIFHVSSASASAYTLKIDDIKVSPSTYAYGTPVTDWATYTPTGSWTTNTTYSGQWRRVGKNLEFRIHLALAGAPTASSLTLSYLPAGLSVDTTSLLTTVTDGTVPIATGITKSGGATYDMSAYYNGTTSIAPVVKSASGTYTSGGTNITNLIPATYASGDTVQFYGSVPIAGWSSSVQMSDQTDTRVVAARVSKTGNQTGVAPNNTFVKLLIDTVQDGDTHGMLNVANNRLIAIVPGWYDVAGYTYFGGTNVLANLYIGGIYKNGALHSQGATTVATAGTSFGVGTSGKVYLNVNDYVELFIYGQGNNSASTLTATVINLAVSRISGPSAIAATESVNCVYQSTAATSYNNGPTTYALTTKIKDTHNAFSSNVFTAPTTGMYSVSFITALGGTMASGTEAWAWAQKTGSASTNYYIGGVVGQGSNTNFTISGSVDIPLVAGDQVLIKLQTSTAGSLVEAVSVNRSAILSIKKTGN